MTQPASNAVRLVEFAVATLVDVVARAEARSASVRFTGRGENVSSFDNFVWISVDRIAGENGAPDKLWACTNDFDAFVRPSFSLSVEQAQAGELIGRTCEYVIAKMARYSRVDILVQAEAQPNRPQLPTLVGDSESGPDGVHEQVLADVF
ncbi:MAG: hypothetical protein K2Z81_03060 [Cyanobacteria bacterium]|nr:hypothetical protein [Cyanobacteriota bacterium]